MRGELAAPNDVTAQLFEAFEPVVAECEKLLPRVVKPPRLRYVVPLNPLQVRVTYEPGDGSGTVAFCQIPPRFLPARGAALASACEAFATGVLSGMRGDAGEAVALNALVTKGPGLVVRLDPEDGRAELWLAIEGRALFLGALAAGPETVH